MKKGVSTSLVFGLALVLCFSFSLSFISALNGAGYCYGDPNSNPKWNACGCAGGLVQDLAQLRGVSGAVYTYDKIASGFSTSSTGCSSVYGLNCGGTGSSVNNYLQCYRGQTVVCTWGGSYNGLLYSVKGNPLGCSVKLNPNCTDSDGGLNYYTLGYLDITNTPTAGYHSQSQDYCFNGTVLREVYCNTSGSVNGINGYSEIYYTCPNGCSDGACINATNTPVPVSSCSGQTCTLNEGDTLIILGKQVSLSFLSSSQAMFNVNGTYSPNMGLYETQTINGISITLSNIYVQTYVGGSQYVVFNYSAYVPTTPTCPMDKTCLTLQTGELKQVQLGSVIYSIAVNYLDQEKVKLSINGALSPYLTLDTNSVYNFAQDYSVQLLDINYQNFAGGSQSIDLQFNSVATGTFPEPFLVGNSVDAGVIFGSGAPTSDAVAATDLSSSLANKCGSNCNGTNVVVKDTEADAVSANNLIVVGNPCQNTVARTILGLSNLPLDLDACYASVGSSENIGPGQYMIKVTASPYNAAKVALLVFGYSAADTTNGVAEVKEGTISTAIGTVFIGPALAENETICTDSDSGLDYYTKGTVCFNGTCKIDSCINGTSMNLEEYYCQAKDDIGSSGYQCPNGCSNGACISANLTCTPRYYCTLDQIICPASGNQTKSCQDVECNNPGYTEIVQCNPGQCAGCEFENKCIPYGFRTSVTLYQNVQGKFNLYCDIDGQLKQQKVKIGSEYASCQNNYECDSNLCSDGWCVELKEVLQQVNAFKGTFIRVVCRLANLFSGDNYNKCIYNYLGSPVPVQPTQTVPAA